MRVALIDPSLFTLPYDQALVRGLTAAGHQVVLHGRAEAAREGGADVPVTASFYRVAGRPAAARLPRSLRLLVKGLDHTWSMATLPGRLRQEEPDVIHFQWLPLPLLDGMMLPRLRAIAPVVLTIHDSDPFNGAPSAGLQARGFQRCLHQADQLIVHTMQGEARLRQMGLPARRIAVRPHGMLCDIAPESSDSMTGRPLTFLLFGKVKPYKGADLLLAAFAALPPALQAQARIRIVGKPYMDMAALSAMAAKLEGVSIETSFVADADIPALFGPDTVAVFPYREIEASGVMFLALAHGRPIIASRLGSFAEMIRDGVEGRLVSPGNIQELSSALKQMIVDRRFARCCAAGVRLLAISIPSWEEIARSTVALYEAASCDRLRLQPYSSPAQA